MAPRFERIQLAFRLSALLTFLQLIKMSFDLYSHPWTNRIKTKTGEPMKPKHSICKKNDGNKEEEEEKESRSQFVMKEEPIQTIFYCERINNVLYSLSAKREYGVSVQAV